MFLRTNSGGFVNLDHVVRLVPRRSENGEAVAAWLTVGEDGRAVALDPFYAGPGRLELAIGFVPAANRRRA